MWYVHDMHVDVRVCNVYMKYTIHLFIYNSTAFFSSAEIYSYAFNGFVAVFFFHLLLVFSSALLAHRHIEYEFLYIYRSSAFRRHFLFLHTCLYILLFAVISRTICFFFSIFYLQHCTHHCENRSK